jgi:hypothetical protein
MRSWVHQALAVARRVRDTADAVLDELQRLVSEARDES